MEFYIREISDSTGIVAYKYGISKDSNGQRLYIFKSTNRHTGYSFNTIKVISSDDKIILGLEKFLKQLFKSNFLSKEQLPDGYTETVHPDKLPLILSIVDELLSSHECIVNPEKPKKPKKDYKYFSTNVKKRYSRIGTAKKITNLEQFKAWVNSDKNSDLTPREKELFIEKYISITNK